MSEEEGAKPRRTRSSANKEDKETGRSAGSKAGDASPKHFNFGAPREDGGSDRKPFRKDDSGSEKPVRRTPRKDGEGFAGKPDFKSDRPAYKKEGGRFSSDEKPARRAPRKDGEGYAGKLDFKSDRPAYNREGGKSSDDKPFRRGPRKDGEGYAGKSDFKSDRPAYNREGSKSSDDKPFRRGPRKEGEGYVGKSDFKSDRPAYNRDASKSSDDKPFRRGPRKDGEGYAGKSDFKSDRPDFKKEGGRFGDEKPSRGRRPRTETGSTSSYNRDDKPRFDKPKEYGDKPFRGKSRDGQDSKPYKKDGFEKPASRGGFSNRTGPVRRNRKDDDFGKQGEWLDPEDFKKDLEKISEKKGGLKPEKTEGSLGYRPDFVKTEYKGPVRRPAKKHSKLEEKDGKIRLNRYISNAGICSRREADSLIESGVIRVNGEIITQLGFRVSPIDKIQYGEQTLSRESPQYLLLNKPKDFITTSNDPEGRKTVMELVKGACKERLYPVGRLDRSTTGLLLMTNDGELAKRLTHPSHGVRKIYHVTLDKNLQPVDLKKITEGFELEDGFIEVDEIAWASQDNKQEVGVVLHSGKNRIVRRIFEHLGYEIVKLDRTGFAGLTKKNLPRGNYRFLTEKEVIMLRMS